MRLRHIANEEMNTQRPLKKRPPKERLLIEHACIPLFVYPFVPFAAKSLRCQVSPLLHVAADTDALDLDEAGTAGGQDGEAVRTC